MIDEPWHPSSADLLGLVDGSLPHDQADLVSQHLNECSGCHEAIENVSASAHALVANLGHEKVAEVIALRHNFTQCSRPRYWLEL